MLYPIKVPYTLTLLSATQLSLRSSACHSIFKTTESIQITLHYLNKRRDYYDLIRKLRRSSSQVSTMAWQSV